jgi:hypothetical protein
VLLFTLTLNPLLTRLDLYVADIEVWTLDLRLFHGVSRCRLQVTPHGRTKDIVLDLIRSYDGSTAARLPKLSSPFFLLANGSVLFMKITNSYDDQCVEEERGGT